MDDSIPRSAPGPHPTPEQLYRARRGPRNAEAERHLAHAALCADCSAELARLEAFDQPEEMSPKALDAQWERFGAPRAAQPPARRDLPVFQRFALAAAAVLALSFGVGLWRASLSIPENGGGTPGDTLRGGEEITAGTFQPSGTLPAAPVEIRFPAGDGTPLRVTVYDDTGGYAWTSPPVTDGRVVLPADEQRKLRPGVEYSWTVLGDDSAPAQTFRIEAQ